MSANSYLSCFRILMRPLLRFCLRHNIKIQEIVEVCKSELVNLAQIELNQCKVEVTTSKLSVMTGLQRKDITKLSSRTETQVPVSLVSKVLGLWITSRRFRNKQGDLTTLNLEDFYALVTSVSKDLNPRTVLDELVRVGSAKITDKNVEVIRASYVPKGDIEGGFKIAAHDLGDLIDAVDENLSEMTTDLPHHHLRTEFDRINASALPDIRKWLLIQGKEFHRRAREYLSQFDLDINPESLSNAKGHRVSISSFALSEIERKEK